VRSEIGYCVKFKLYTVPGQVAHDATRKAVLSRADGVVFVADSQASQAVSNFESFDNLEKNAGRVGLDFAHLPLVVQFNKRDLPDILTAVEIDSRWRPTGLPITLASAVNGDGVRETFRQLLLETYRSLDGTLHLHDRYRIDPSHFASVLPAGA
jgi:hypothetical protein